MYVITFANPKGGSGKTTSAMLLAEQIAISGGRVAVLDLDPNANILAWAQARRAQGREVPFAVHARPQAEETVELIDSIGEKADYLIVDLEGSKDQIVTFALSRTDLCVIPLDGSPMEARQAAAAVKLVQTTASMIRAPIAYTLLFTRTNAAFQSTDERDVRAEMSASDIAALSVRGRQARALHPDLPGWRAALRAARHRGEGDGREDRLRHREGDEAGGLRHRERPRLRAGRD